MYIYIYIYIYYIEGPGGSLSGARELPRHALCDNNITVINGIISSTVIISIINTIIITITITITIITSSGSGSGSSSSSSSSSMTSSIISNNTIIFIIVMISSSIIIISCRWLMWLIAPPIHKSNTTPLWAGTDPHYQFSQGRRLVFKSA